MHSHQRLVLLSAESVSQVSLFLYLLLLGQGLAFEPVLMAVFLFAGVANFSFFSAMVFADSKADLRPLLPGRASTLFLFGFLSAAPWFLEPNHTVEMMKWLSPYTGIAAVFTLVVVVLILRTPLTQERKTV